MSPDSTALLGLALGVVVLLGVALSRRTGLPDPVVLVAAGAAASFASGAAVPDLPPDLVFLVFLPPLLYRASFLTHPTSLRANALGLVLLAVGLVVLTAVSVALVVAALVPQLGFSGGLVLGAVVAPTDPVAAAGVFSRLGAPTRVVELVEGESLVNDASALVLYTLAVQAVVSGPPTVGSALLLLVVAVAGGAAVGWVVARLVVLVRGRVHDTGLQLLMSLLTPYAAYLLADEVHASGVLAVVTTGVLLGARQEGLFGPEVRVQSTAFWSLLELVLNAVLFVLLGLEVRRVLDGAPRLGAPRLAAYAAAVIAVVVGTRLLWQLVVPAAVTRLQARTAGGADRWTTGERLVVGWTGMRGAISLAAALALPLTAGRGAFPGRALILYLTVCVVLATLVVQGLSLPLLLTRLGLAGSGHESRGEAEQEARLALADVALSRLDELEAHEDVPRESVAPLRQVWEQSRDRLAPDAEDPAEEVDLVRLRLELAQLQSEEVERRLREGRIPPDVARELRHEIDLQQLRLSRGHG